VTNDTGPAVLALVVAGAVHLGFQLTVTVLVYPSLARVGPDDWSAAHERHSRAIVPLVVLVYGALVLTGSWALVSARSPWVLASLIGAGLSLLTTALIAAPLHGRLAAGPQPELVRRLLRADLVRTLGAFVCLAAGIMASV
jgi:hypothetical protein